jgi:hypothetical protein
MYGLVDVQIHIFLISALVGGEWSVSHAGRFTPGERALGTHWIGGWVGRRTGLEDMERTILFLPGLELRPLGRSASSQSLCSLGYPGSVYLAYCLKVSLCDYHPACVCAYPPQSIYLLWQLSPSQRRTS